MKLVFCTFCKDVFKLVGNVRSCSCGKASGVVKEAYRYPRDKPRYTTQQAIITGSAKVLGIDDRSLYSAIDNAPEMGTGKDFTAYVLPTKCLSVKVIGNSKQKAVEEKLNPTPTVLKKSPYGVLPPKEQPKE
jgi:hypothetical protein